MNIKAAIKATLSTVICLTLIVLGWFYPDKAKIVFCSVIVLGFITMFWYACYKSFTERNW